ncbi:MAG: RNA methyltransferase [Clostridia bacterium]|nr:RNA methyltransferase [Clostridia bacterium]
MTDIISSTKNQFVKLAKSLQEKKFRNETGLFLAEGINLLKDMPDSVAVEYIFATKQRMDDLSSIFSSEKSSGLFNTRAQVYCVTDDVMQYMSDTKTPYGVLAVCRIPDKKFSMPEKNAILLDCVTDPGNIGTIIRCAAACDFKDVYLLDTADIYSPKVVRATLGGLFRVNTYVIDIDEARELISSTESIVLDMGGENILEKKVEGPVLLIAGSEAHGVRDEFLGLAKKTYSLPMHNGIESLNVAIASAVAMYQIK